MKKLGAFLLIIVTVAMCYIHAFAVQLVMGDSGIDVRSLQLRLNELGYYEKDVTGEFDIATQAAVDRFCQDNGVSIADGISRDVWETIFDSAAASRPKQTRSAAIFPGSAGEHVTALQARLLELGYYQEEFIPGEYDPATQYAQDRFCRNHGILPQSGATVELQQIVLSQGAKAQAADLPVAAFQEGAENSIQSFLLRPVELGRFRIPSVLLYCSIIIFVGGTVLLLFQASRQNRTESIVKTPKKERQLSEANRNIKLTVIYRGKSKEHKLAVDEMLPVGRAVGGVQLDQSDSGVSRMHCDLYFQGSTLMLRDHSQSGSFINGARVYHAQSIVKSGDTIQISRHSIQVEY